MKGLPYFRWFPADAEGDDFYISLSPEEYWIYHRCLNRSWINDGIPADLDELARIFNITRKRLDRLWAKVGRKWVTSSRDASRLVNPRQEEERDHATAISEKNRRPGNANAVKENRDRNANANPARSDRDAPPYNANGSRHAHAGTDSECVSGSDSSGSSGDLQPVNAREALDVLRTAEYQRDEAFCRWKAEYEHTGASFLENDWIEAYVFGWKPLDFEQKLAAIKGFEAQLEAGMWSDPSRVPRPKNYLQRREFNRKAVKPRPGMSARTAAVEQNLSNLRRIGNG